MKAFIKAVIIVLTACVFTGCASEYRVSTAGLDENPGSKSKPFKTISAAAQFAQPGDRIAIHEGTYRERVNPPRGGLPDDKRIVYEDAPGEKVVIKGSDIINNWQYVQNDTRKVVIPNFFSEISIRTTTLFMGSGAELPRSDTTVTPARFTGMSNG